MLLTPLGPVSAEVERITGRSKTWPIAACAMMLFWYRLGSQSLAMWYKPTWISRISRTW